MERLGRLNSARTRKVSLTAPNDAPSSQRRPHTSSRDGTPLEARPRSRGSSRHGSPFNRPSSSRPGTRSSSGASPTGTDSRPGSKKRRVGGGGSPASGRLKHRERTPELVIPVIEGLNEEQRQAKLLVSEEEVMESKHLDDLVTKLARGIAALNSKLNNVERQMSQNVTNGPGMLPFQVRRAEHKQALFQKDLVTTAQSLRRAMIMSNQMKSIIEFRDEVFQQTKDELLKEIEELKKKRAENAEPIRQGYIGRINMLNRYWPWRQLLELGDTVVGGTFEEELQRGPRYRHVGIQSTIESDFIEQQLHWLQEFSSREEGFRHQVQQLDNLVEDLCDIDDLLESTLTCTVCQLLFDSPVVFWPCGHSFCRACFESLAIAPQLFRCPMCGGVGNEGYLHNLLIAETVAKWMFKDLGYGDLRSPLNSMRVHLSKFQKDRVEGKLKELRTLLRQSKLREGEDRTITVMYRTY